MVFVVPAKAGTQGKWLRMVYQRPCVYILASRRNGTLLYRSNQRLGASHLAAPVERSGRLCSGLWRLSACLRRVRYHYGAAILREKQLEKWRRSWKLELIE